MLRRVLTPVVLVALLAVAACGGSQEEADPRPAPSASPSAPPGVDTTPPSRPTGQSHTTGSAVAYARWFAQLVQFALEARDSEAVSQEAFDQAACSGCRSLATFIADLRKSGFWQVSDDLAVGRLTASGRQGVVRVTGSLTYPQVRDLTADGKVSRTIPPKPYGYKVDLSWDETKGSWRVRDYSFRPRG